MHIELRRIALSAEQARTLPGFPIETKKRTRAINGTRGITAPIAGNWTLWARARFAT